MTIKDLARNLNVSYSTVSKCLNNDPHVSEKTRARVLAEAKRTGFVLNANARGLATKKTRRIGIVFSNHFNRKEYRWFFSEVETYATRAVEEQGYDYFIQPHNNIRGESNILRMASGKVVDGLLIVSRGVTQEEFRFLESSAFPHIFCYYNPVFLEDIHPNLFWDDDELGGYIATRHLIDHGHRNILTLRADDAAMKMYEARTAGYFRAMGESGLAPAVVELPMRFADARAFVRERLSFLKAFSALFVQQDQPALSIILELQNTFGIAVPDQVSVVGYNNIDLIGDLNIQLDTVDDPMETVIRSATFALVANLEGKDEQEIRQRQPRLIMRGSVRFVD